MLGSFVRFRISPSIFGYLLIGLGMILAVLVPSTLFGLPGPGGYVLSHYQIVSFAPLVPAIGIAIGIATIWSVNRLSRTTAPLVRLSSGFILTLAFFWITAVEPGTFVRGLGFPLSWILVLALPLRPTQVLGTSIVAFLIDWALWTLFIDSLTFVSERRRFRKRFSLYGRPH
jgi:hypothetical protein